MSKNKLILRFDKSEAKDAFAVFMQGAWNDIAQYLKQSLQQHGIDSDPSVSVDIEKGTVDISVISQDKGMVITSPENGKLDTIGHSTLKDGDKYVIFGSGALDIFVRNVDGADKFIGKAPSFDSLAENLFDFVDPTAEVEVAEEVEVVDPDVDHNAVMEVAPDEEEG